MRSLVAIVASAISMAIGTLDGLRRRRRLHAARRAPRGAADRRADRRRRPRDPLPRDRRARPAGPAARDPRRHDAEHGALAGRRHAPPARVGDRPVLADRGEPGRHPARRQRRHPRLPLGRQGDRDDDDLLEPGRLRHDRARPVGQPGAARRRRDEPGQPALGRRRRRHPHRQPPVRREVGEPRLPRVPGQRPERDADAGAVPLGAVPRARRRGPAAPARRPPARSPRRQLPAASAPGCASSSAT